MDQATDEELRSQECAGPGNRTCELSNGSRNELLTALTDARPAYVAVQIWFMSDLTGNQRYRLSFVEAHISF